MIDLLKRLRQAGRMFTQARMPRRARVEIEGKTIKERSAPGGIGAETAQFLADRISDLRPERVLECGPGASTIMMARVMQKLGIDGTIVSLEHDEGWAEVAQSRIDEAGVHDFVDLVVTPLTPALGDHVERLNGCGVSEWYESIDAIVERGPYDFVFVDGPPALDGRPRRAPVLPLLWDAINDGAEIVLDDGNRPGEKETVRYWRDRFGPSIDGELLSLGKGLWHMHKRPLPDDVSSGSAAMTASG
ncbi:MAG: class I SAM-dependent methyltransferase [Planctomycetota bacterium]